MRPTVIPMCNVVVRNGEVAKMVYKLLHTKKTDCNFLLVKKLMLLALLKMKLMYQLNSIIMEHVSSTKLGLVNTEKNSRVT